MLRNDTVQYPRFIDVAKFDRSRPKRRRYSIPVQYVEFHIRCLLFAEIPYEISRPGQARFGAISRYILRYYSILCKHGDIGCGCPISIWHAFTANAWSCVKVAPIISTFCPWNMVFIISWNSALQWNTIKWIARKMEQKQIGNLLCKVNQVQSIKTVGNCKISFSKMAANDTLNFSSRREESPAHKFVISSYEDFVTVLWPCEWPLSDWQWNTELQIRLRKALKSFSPWRKSWKAVVTWPSDLYFIP